MSDYVPTTEQVRAWFIDPTPWANPDRAGVDFDDWLAGYTRVKQAEALEEAAQSYPFTLMGVGATWHEAQKVLCERAAEYRKGESDD